MYHLYDITRKIKDTANRVNLDFERAEGLRSENGILDNNITENTPVVNAQSQEYHASVREAPAPQKTQDVYKLMRLGRDGKLYPLFIDSAVGIDTGVWYDADSPDFGFMKKMPEGVFLVDDASQTYTSLEEYQRQHGGTEERKYPAKQWVNEATKNGQRFGPFFGPSFFSASRSADK